METQSQQEYLSALDSQDSEWIAVAGRKLTEVMTPGPNGRRKQVKRGTSMTPSSGLYDKSGETPYGQGGETPMSVSSTTSTETSKTSKPSINTNLSLSAFQTKYTSEDNESFYKLLDKQNFKKAEKYAWMWAGNKIPAARQIAHRQREARLLADAESNGQQQLAISVTDTRKAMPDSWPARPDNNFMFDPSPVEDSLSTVQQRAEERSRAPPKAVVYDNTRLVPQTTGSDADSGQLIPPSPSLSAVEAALAGRPRPTDSESGFLGGETPRVNGYAFVDSREPSPSPSEMRSQWGNTSLDNNSAGILLGGGDGTKNPFSIKERSKREELHLRMVDKVAKGKRLGKEVATQGEPNTPVPRFMSSPRVARGGLTPAGRRLLGKVGTPRISSGLKNGWTSGEKET